MRQCHTTVNYETREHNGTDVPLCVQYYTWGGGNDGTR